MTTLTLQQTAAYARAAGFTGDALVDIVAVATPESSLRTDVVNSIGATGLWQINQPVHVKDHPQWSQAWLKDPANNAAAAKIIYDQQGMSAWQAWTDGSAAAYMDAARAAVSSVGGGTGGTAAPTPTPVPTTDMTTDQCDKAYPTDLDWIPGHAAAREACKAGAKDPGAPSGPSLTDAIAAIAKFLGNTALWVTNPANIGRLVQVVLGGALVLAGLQRAGVPVLGAAGAVLPPSRALAAAKKVM